ncbi:MAG: hypothetical protein ACI9U2_001047 [Bradymonadia bacterium]|jgi:hypothetical protein
MKRLNTCLLAVAAIALCASSAQAVDLDGKKGIGYTNTISGVNGFNFQMGVGNLILEGILGTTMATPKDFDAGGRDLSIGLGAHFQALRAQSAAWTVGGRIEINNNVNATPEGADSQDGVTEFGISIPTRVYWFPNKNISLHVESGIQISFPPKAADTGETGNIGGPASVGGPESLGFAIFDISSGIGMTFWW